MQDNVDESIEHFTLSDSEIQNIEEDLQSGDLVVYSG